VIKARPIALAILALAACPPLAANAAPDPFYERTLMSAANARCQLFDPALAAALAASARQARGAALRGGADPDALAAVEARARARAGAVPCGSADLKLAAARVRDAFAGYSRMRAMDFPGEHRAWRAERTQAAPAGGGWRLSQSGASALGPATFGIAVDANGRESLVAVAGWPAALAASGARLVLRDPAKAPRAYVDPRAKTLADRLPPRSITRAILASDKAAAAPGLLPAGASAGAAFTFPASAAAALQRLDPREAVLLELTYPSLKGERTERIPLEVGDFAAGVAFLSAAR
jgi:hypothetical protein